MFSAHHFTILVVLLFLAAKSYQFFDEDTLFLDSLCYGDQGKMSYCEWASCFPNHGYVELLNYAAARFLARP
jgi:hypothetical protein